MSATVVNVGFSDYDVYIGRNHPRYGRASVFANPFRMPTDGCRDVVVDKYKFWLYEMIMSGIFTREQFVEMDGMRLGCFCHPKSCHGHVLVRVIDWAVESFDLDTLKPVIFDSQE